MKNEILKKMNFLVLKKIKFRKKICLTTEKLKKTLFLLDLVPNGGRHRIPEVESLRFTQFAAQSDKISLLFGNFPFPHPPTQSTLKQQSKIIPRETPNSFKRD